jgi:hypothetical protein
VENEKFNLATYIPEKLTVYEMLTELNEEQLKDLEEMIAEIRQMRKEIEESEEE